MRPQYLAAAAALCLAAAAGIVAITVADQEYVTVNLAYTAGGLLAFGLAGAAAGSIVGSYPLAWIGWLSVAVAVTGLGL
jgi:hypothetical protein